MCTIQPGGSDDSFTAHDGAVPHGDTAIASAPGPCHPVPYPRLGQAVVLLLLMIPLQLVVGIMAGVLLVATGHRDALHSSAVTGVGNAVTFAVLIAWAFHRTGARFREVFPLSAFPAVLLLPLLLFVLGFAVVASEADNLLRYLAPPPAFIIDMFEEFTQPSVASVLTLVLVAPITEELLFRGVILRGFLAWYGRGKAVAASALLFALIHLNPYQFFSAFCLGLVFAWLLIRTRSLAFTSTPAPPITAPASDGAWPFSILSRPAKQNNYVSSTKSKVPLPTRPTFA